MKYLKSTKARVKKFLETVPGNRDNFNALMANIWHEDLKALSIKPDLLGSMGFLKMLAEKRLTDSASCRRNWRKLQEIYPDLRGEKYNERKNKKEPEVRKEIIYYDD